MTISEQSSCARWRRRKAARPAEILAAALASFAERGYAATRLDDVAARAGVTKGTLYLYFPSKEELFKAVVRQSIVPNIARNEAMVAQSNEPSAVLLERLVRQWVEISSMPTSALPKLILTEAGNFPDLARFYLDEVAGRGLRLLQRVLERGIERGEFRPIDTAAAARCVVAPMLVTMLWRHSLEPHEHASIDIATLCHTHIELLQRGLSAAPAAGSRENEVPS
jgi:AcrR family transcriptional regulator